METWDADGGPRRSGLGCNLHIDGIGCLRRANFARRRHGGGCAATNGTRKRRIREGLRPRRPDGTLPRAAHPGVDLLLASPYDRGRPPYEQNLPFESSMASRAVPARDQRCILANSPSIVFPDAVFSLSGKGTSVQHRRGFGFSQYSARIRREDLTRLTFISVSKGEE